MLVRELALAALVWLNPLQLRRMLLLQRTWWVLPSVLGVPTDTMSAVALLLPMRRSSAGVTGLRMLRPTLLWLLHGVRGSLLDRPAVEATILRCVQLVGLLRLLPLRTSGSAPRLTSRRRLAMMFPPPTTIMGRTLAPSARSRWRVTSRTLKVVGENIAKEGDVVVAGGEDDPVPSARDLYG